MESLRLTTREEPVDRTDNSEDAEVSGELEDFEFGLSIVSGNSAVPGRTCDERWGGLDDSLSRHEGKKRHPAIKHNRG